MIRIYIRLQGGVRSPHICRGRLAAGSQRADSLGSCATPVASVGLSRASISSVGIRQTARLVLTYLFVRVERDGSRWPAHLVANLSRSTRALHRSPRRRLRLRRLLPRVHASTRPTQHCVDSTLRPVTLSARLRVTYSICRFSIASYCVKNTFSALTLLVGRQEGHPTCKN